MESETKLKFKCFHLRSLIIMGENTVMGVNKTQSMPEILKEKDDVKVTYV